MMNTVFPYKPDLLKSGNPHILVFSHKKLIVNLYMLELANPQTFYCSLSQNQQINRLFYFTLYKSYTCSNLQTIDNSPPLLFKTFYIYTHTQSFVSLKIPFCLSHENNEKVKTTYLAVNFVWNISHSWWRSKFNAYPINNAEAILDDVFQGVLQTILKVHVMIK